MQSVFELPLTIPLDGQGHVSCKRAAVHGAPGNVRTPPHTHTGESVHGDVYGESYPLFSLSSFMSFQTPPGASCWPCHKGRFFFKEITGILFCEIKMCAFGWEVISPRALP